jgi:hypothetical protein
MPSVALRVALIELAGTCLNACAQVLTAIANASRSNRTKRPRRSVMGLPAASLDDQVVLNSYKLPLRSVQGFG